MTEDSRKWRVDDCRENKWILGNFRVCEGEFVVANISGQNSIVSEERNAHLIAAAPEMYEMLERLVKWDVNFPVGDDTGRGLKELDSIIAEASAIMKKARGEQ